ncbi:amino acid transporter [Microbacterium sp. Root61]|uniref:DUF4245 family protein n=1 Tax=Microbacterium sp. Root61 TaxID=1736570 RepID=UPI0006F9A946|nr:DUF4245 family protein [Microbacterium sp. Root61]KRA23859.1 amino acid transporter [Microbacterium sp. Root61]
MAVEPRVVAELGRPETPDETAARKAESSRVYRGSQTTRNLIAALLVTVAVVAVVIFAVPRGTPPPRAAIDVTAVAASVESALDRTVIVPDAPAEWSVNGAAVEGNASRAWTIVYAPEGETGFLRIAQGFDADAAWPARVLNGAAVHETVTIDGIEWDSYQISDPERAGNVSAALSTPAGTDVVLIYGSASDATLRTAASAVADDVRALREESNE